MRVGVYRRISTDEQKKGYSLEIQESDLQAYCASQGYTIVADESDIASGFKLEKRPGLARIRALIAAEQIDLLLVWKLDRLTRRMWHLPPILDECEEHKVSLRCYKEPHLDTSTPTGKFMIMAVVYVAEQERSTFIERSEAGRRARAASGRPFVGPRPPYGYRWVFGDITMRGTLAKIALEPNPETAPVVIRIFTELAKGTSTRTLCSMLDADQIPTPHGAASWETSTINSMVKQGVYYGAHVSYAHTWKEEKRVHPRTGEVKTVLKAYKGESIPTPSEAAPALISPEIAQAVRE